MSALNRLTKAFTQTFVPPSITVSRRATTVSLVESDWNGYASVRAYAEATFGAENIINITSTSYSTQTTTAAYLPGVFLPWGYRFIGQQNGYNVYALPGGSQALFIPVGKYVFLKPPESLSSTINVPNATYRSGTQRIDFPIVEYHHEAVVTYWAPLYLQNPGYFAQTNNPGWNAGARSVDVMSDDGYFELEYGVGAQHLILGLTPEAVAGTSTSPVDTTHAFYVSASTIKVMEEGEIVADSEIARTDAVRLRIMRKSGAVIYAVYSQTTDVLLWKYTSTAASTGNVYFDVSIYLSGNYVELPVFEAAAEEIGLNGITATLPAFVCGMSDISDWVNVALPPFTLTWAPPSGLINATLPAARARMMDVYGDLFALELPAFTATVRIIKPLAEPIVELTQINARIVMGVELYGYTSLPLSINAEIAVASWLSDHAMRRVAAALPTPVVAMGTRGSIGAPFVPPEMIQVVSWFYADPDIAVTIMSTLEFDTEIANADLSIVFDKAMLDTLNLSSEFSLNALLDVLLQSGITLSGYVVYGNEYPDVQYAVNIANAALTTYRNFDFSSFTQLNGEVYGTKPDGLYRLRTGDDDGVLRDVFIDFGGTDFGTTTRKNVDSIYFGLDTDADQVVARVVYEDGAERDYAVRMHHPTATATMSRATVARKWRLQLQALDTTEFKLDTVEYSVGVHTRRRMV